MEELAKVAEIVGNLGEQGKEAFMVYVAYKALHTLVWATVVGGALYALLRRIGQAISNACKKRD